MKHIWASLLCIALLLAMVLTLTGCPETGTGEVKTTDDGKTAGGDSTDGSGAKKYTEEDAKTALAGMNEQVTGQSKFAADLTISVTVPYAGMTADLSIPLTIETDTETNVYHLRATIPGILMGERRNTTVEAYVSPTGTYLGTDRDVTDENGKPVMSYLYFSEITTDFISGIIAGVPADDDNEVIGDPDGTVDFDDFEGLGDFGDLAGIRNVNPLLPRTTLKLTAAAGGGYYLTATADIAKAIRALMPTVVEMLGTSPRSLTAKILTVDRVREVGDMPVETLVARLDGTIGGAATDALLTQVVLYLRGNTGETDEAFDVRKFLDGCKGMTVLDAYLAVKGENSDAGQKPTYEAIVTELLSYVPDKSIGSLVTIPGTGETLTEYLAGMVVTACKASVTFTLTDTYLPTAAKAEAMVEWTKDGAIGGITVGAKATTAYDRAVILPEDLLVLPTETKDMVVFWMPGGHLDAVLTFELNGFSVSDATVQHNGTTVTVTPVVDAATGEISLSGIEREEGVPTTEFKVTLTFTRTIGDHTYTYSETVALPLGEAE